MIKNLPSRLPEVGRLRLGEKVESANGKIRPDKAETLIFTSNDVAVLEAAAAQYGGTVEPWSDGTQTHRVVSSVKTIPVLLPDEPIDTSYERWGSGGVARRCDGQRCVYPVIDPEGGHMDEDDCLCIAEGKQPGEDCKPTVRIRLVIPTLPGVGIWMCTSHSINAAMELPPLMGLIGRAAQRGALIPAEFGIEVRTMKKPWEKFERVFPVPVLRVVDSMLAIQGGATSAPAVAAPRAAELPAEPAALAAPAPAATVDVVDIETGEISDDVMTGPLRNAIASLEPWAQKLVHDGWRWGTLKEGGRQPLLVSQEQAAHEFVRSIERKQADAYKARKIEALEAMKAIGVTSERARHELVQEATEGLDASAGGTTESTKTLTQRQLDAIKAKCKEYAASEEEAS